MTFGVTVDIHRDWDCNSRSGSYVVQHISRAIQRGNAASMMDTFGPKKSQSGPFSSVANFNFFL